MSRIVGTLSLLGCLSTAVTGPAGQVVRSAQPTFRGGTELVTVDVVVTDADGRPVRGLSAGDFELLDDGVRQSIDAFQFVDLDAIAPPANLPPGVAHNQTEPGGLFAIVLDELGVEVTDVQQVRRVAEQFLKDAAGPNDRVAVIRAGADSGFFLSADRRLAADVVANASGRRDRGLRLDEPGLSGGAGPTIPNLQDETLRFAEIEGLTPATSATDSLGVLAAVVERFRTIPARRKAVVWFSRGGELRFANFDAYAAGQASGRNDQAVARLIDAARAGNVAIYTIDPRGLQARSVEGSSLAGDAPLGELDTLRELAAATGGRAIVNRNDLSGALRRVAAENRVYYLLGYTPSPSARTRPRTLTVQTTKPGVSLLHRTHYVPRSEAAPVSTPLIAEPLPVRDLPTMMAPAPVVGNGRRRGLVVPFEVDLAGSAAARVSYSIAVVDPAGRQVGAARGTVAVVGGRALSTAHVAINETGLFEVRLAVTAGDSGPRGLVTATVDVPRGKTDEPRCAPFVFQQDGAPALRQFSRTAPLTISTLVTAPSLAEIPLAFGLGSAGLPADRTWRVTPDRSVASGVWQLQLTLRPPLPRGVADISLLNGTTLLGEGCRARFEMR